MLHHLSATTAGVTGTTVNDLGSAERPMVASLVDESVFVADENAFVFSSSAASNYITFENATLGSPFGATLSFWWRHE